MQLKYLSLCPIQNILHPGSSESSVQIKNMFILAKELLASISYEIHVMMWRGGAQGKTWSYLVTDQNVNASRTLFEDLANLSGWDVKELSQLLRQLSSCELLQVNGVIYCRNKRNKNRFAIIKFHTETWPLRCVVVRLQFYGDSKNFKHFKQGASALYSIYSSIYISIECNTPWILLSMETNLLMAVYIYIYWNYSHSGRVSEL